MALIDMPVSERTDVQEAALRIREMIAAHATHGRTVMEQINSIVNLFGINKIKAVLDKDAYDLDIWYAASRDAAVSALKQPVADLSTKMSTDIALEGMEAALGK